MHSERCLEGSELGGLETTCRLEPAAKSKELCWRKRLQHIDLRDDRLEDRQDAFESPQGVGRVTCFEAPLEECQLMQELFEPELVNLVDDDEEHLVVLVGARLLRGQHLVEREIRRVRLCL